MSDSTHFSVTCEGPLRALPVSCDIVIVLIAVEKCLVPGGVCVCVYLCIKLYTHIYNVWSSILTHI